MEGRVPHVSDDPHTFDEDDDHHHRSPTPPEQLLPPPPGLLPPPPKETYIVQIPRDQIYRVPPPENAKIVERHQKPTKPKKEKKVGGKYFLWIFIALVILAVIIGVTVGVVRPLATPKPPEFSIDKVHVTFTSTPRPNKHADANTDAKYEITMKATNPNYNMGVSYEDGGKSSLSSASKEIAAGKYPSSYEEPNEESNVAVTLIGPKGSLPSIYDKESKTKSKPTHVDMLLTLKVPVKMKGSISSKKVLKVTCSLRVGKVSTAIRTKIVSQDCKSKF